MSIRKTYEENKDNCNSPCPDKMKIFECRLADVIAQMVLEKIASKTSFIVFLIHLKANKIATNFHFIIQTCPPLF